MTLYVCALATKIKRLLFYGFIFSFFSLILVSPSHSITYGEKVNDPEKETPWLVKIYNAESESSTTSSELVCGGTLIESRIVITAAHCVSNYEYNYVKPLNNSKIYAENLIPVKTLWIHPRYVRKKNLFDIAILYLEEEVVLESYPKLDSSPSLPTEFRTYGWGETEDFFSRNSALRYTDLELQPYGSLKAIGSFKKKYMISAGHYIPLYNEYSGSCSGDSGSPLMNKTNTKLFGLVSWGAAPCTKAPTAYTRIGTIYSDIITGIKTVKKQANYLSLLRPEATSKPTITGDQIVGSTLTCNTGEWTQNPDITFEWWEGGNYPESSPPISTKQTYTVAKNAIGYPIICRVTATKDGRSNFYELSASAKGPPRFTSGPFMEVYFGGFYFKISSTEAVAPYPGNKWACSGTFIPGSDNAIEKEFTWSTSDGTIISKQKYIIWTEAMSKKALQGDSVSCEVTLYNEYGLVTDSVKQTIL